MCQSDGSTATANVVIINPISCIWVWQQISRQSRRNTGVMTAAGPPSVPQWTSPRKLQQTVQDAFRELCDWKTTAPSLNCRCCTGKLVWRYGIHGLDANSYFTDFSVQSFKNSFLHNIHLKQIPKSNNPNHISLLQPGDDGGKHDTRGCMCVAFKREERGRGGERGCLREREGEGEEEREREPKICRDGRKWEWHRNCMKLHDAEHRQGDDDVPCNINPLCFILCRRSLVTQNLPPRLSMSRWTLLSLLQFKNVSVLLSAAARRYLHRVIPMSLARRRPRYIRIDPSWVLTLGSAHGWVTLRSVIARQMIELTALPGKVLRLRWDNLNSASPGRQRWLTPWLSIIALWRRGAVLRMNPSFCSR